MGYEVEESQSKHIDELVELVGDLNSRISELKKKNFEYKIVKRSAYANHTISEMEYLREENYNNWELVSVVLDGTDVKYYFKRKI